MTDKFLDKVYDLETQGDVEQLYDAWAESYDAEIAENGYASPRRVAAALARHAPGASPVLDMGCGTGLSGLALRAAGFAVIDGTDLSAGMLEQARAKGAYRKLWQADPDAPLPVTPGDYAAIAAAGVISPGAAPPELLDQLADALAPGGLLAFSFNDHALEDPAYRDRLDALRASGAFRTLFEEHGDHLPAIGLGSTVYVLEKT